MRMQNVKDQALLRRDPQFAVIRIVPLVLAIAAALGGCSMFASSAPPPACPKAYALKDANHITVYRPGPGRDITDIAYEAWVLGVEGDCSYAILKKSKKAAEQTYSSVTMSLRPRFRVTPGPAMTSYRAQLDYFTAIPAFYPKPEGRAEFSREVELPANRTQLDVTEANIDILIPLNAQRRGETQEVFVGFNLTEDQLRENRQWPNGRLGL